MSEEASVSTPHLVFDWASTWARRRTVGLHVLAGGVVTGVVAFLLPPTFQAVTTVIPATLPDKLGAIGSLGASLEGFGIQTSAKSNSPAIYPEIVKSRRLLEQVLANNYPDGTGGKHARLIDLIQPSGSGPSRTELAVKKLRGRVDAILDRKSGVLTIRVRARQPEVAAGVANTLDTLLQEFTVHSFTSQAGENRKFIEGRLTEVQGALAKAEEELRGFRERNMRIGNSPRLLLEEGRLTRALREQEEVYLTLRRQYELAKIEEYRDVPVINVLDAAAVPAFRISPRRGIMIGMGLLFGGILGVGISLLQKP